MPRGGFFRERVVEVREDEATAAREAAKDDITERGGKSAQEGFGSVGEEPAENFEENEQHANRVMTEIRWVKQTLAAGGGKDLKWATRAPSRSRARGQSRRLRAGEWCAVDDALFCVALAFLSHFSTIRCDPTRL